MVQQVEAGAWPSQDGEFGHVSGAFAVSELLRATDLGAYCAALRRSGHDLPGGTCPSTFTGAWIAAFHLLEL